MDTARRVRSAYRPQAETSGTAGRRDFLYLETISENRFTVLKYRPFPSNGTSAYGRVLSISSQYAEVTDEYLEVVMSSIQKEYPWCGNRQMCGHLLARGLRVQQHRVREIQRKIDPNGSIMHRLSTINRRAYQVPGPKSLYHIDGNHKLIRYVC